MNPGRALAAATLALAAVLAIAGCGGAAEASAPADASPSPEEEHLLFGLRRDAYAGCGPIRADLPKGAVAGIECFPEDQPSDRVALYLFDTQGPLLEAYFSRLADHDIPPRSGDCFTGAGGESGYLPGDDGPVPSAERQGCYVDDSGATWLGTLPPFVLAEVHGAPADIGTFLRWPWLGNQDVPGAPTIWRAGGPVSPEK